MYLYIHMCIHISMCSSANTYTVLCAYVYTYKGVHRFIFFAYSSIGEDLRRPSPTPGQPLVSARQGGQHQVPPGQNIFDKGGDFEKVTSKRSKPCVLSMGYLESLYFHMTIIW